MAEVFEATADGDRGFSRRVAIKRMLAAHDTDPSFARMFLDEARIASQLHHASIVSVIDYGIVDGRPFQALELVDGMDAHALTKRAKEVGRPMPEAIALHLCTEIAHALAYAHGAKDEKGAPMGIVHRDVSPGNILVSWNGDVKLTDFGIAKATEREEQTEAGVAKGKLVYMSPEQATAGSVDPRTDVFALGCVLHALLRGASPLKDPDAMRQLFSDGELQITDALPEDLRAIIVKATRRDLSARYQSAAEMAKDLGEAAAARLRTTPRNALCEWLERLRPEPKSGVRRSGKLDDLLDVEIVLGGTDAEGVRQFESTEVRESTALAETEVGEGEAPTAFATPQAKVGEAASLAPERGHRRSVIAIAGLVLVVGVAVGAWALRASQRAPAPVVAATGTETRTAAETEIETAAETDTDTETDTAAAETAAETETATETAAATETEMATETSAPSIRRRRRRPTRAMTESAEPVPAMGPAGQGVLLIGGASAHRAEIFVDGRSRGFAPKRLELPVGSHRVELRSENGASLGTRTIELSARNTRSSPARWLLN